MARFLTLAVLALLTVAEVATVVALERWLGAGLTLLVLGLDMALGLMIMSWAMRTPPPRGWRLAAGAVIALPGLVLDLVGLLLLVPAVQRWASTHLTRGTESLLRRQGVSVVTVTDAAGVPRATVVPGDVIPGEVVETSEPASTSSPSDAAGDDGPRIVRGELAAGD
ncbi:MAG TPA: FxsA family protein [Candidatus Nanopelagicales bacterium]